MPSTAILEALHREQAILNDATIDFEAMQTVMDGQKYLAVNQQHATLYYFTIS